MPALIENTGAEVSMGLHSRTMVTAMDIYVSEKNTSDNGPVALMQFWTPCGDKNAVKKMIVIPTISDPFLVERESDYNGGVMGSSLGFMTPSTDSAPNTPTHERYYSMLERDTGESSVHEEGGVHNRGGHQRGEWRNGCRLERYRIRLRD